MKCSECKYCYKEDEDWFQCHRNSPRIIESMCAIKDTQRYADMLVNDWPDFAVWPQIMESDWCGEFQSKDDPPEEMLSRPVSSFCFSVRVSNVLEREHINTIGQLIQLRSRKLGGYRGIGGVGLREIKRKLADSGLYLKN